MFIDNSISDNVDDWDESKLSEVAEKKHGEHDRKRPNQTDIVTSLYTSVFLCNFLANINFVSLSRFVNIFWKLLKIANTVGFGNVQMEMVVFIGMPCHQVMF